MALVFMKIGVRALGAWGKAGLTRGRGDPPSLKLRRGKHGDAEKRRMGERAIWRGGEGGEGAAIYRLNDLKTERLCENDTISVNASKFYRRVRGGTQRENLDSV